MKRTEDNRAFMESRVEHPCVLLIAVCTCVLSLLSAFPASAGEPVDILILHGHILTIDDGMVEFPDGGIAIRDKRLIAIGASDEIAAEYSGDRVIDAAGGIVIPGMVNAHTHVPMVAFRSLGEEGVKDRLFSFFFPLESKLVTPGLVYTASLHGIIEMAMGGVTTFADMYYFEDQVARATETIGIRGVLGETVIGFPVADAPDAYGGLAYADRFIGEYRGHELVTPAVAPHAPFTVAPEKLRECRALAEKHQVPMLLHVAEFEDEAVRVQTKYGANPEGLSIVRYLEKEGVLFPGLVIAHSTHVDGQDLDILGKRGVGIAVNTIANTKGATGVAPLADMQKAGLRVGLGTDGPMSANTLDMFNAMGYAARVNKLFKKDNTVMTPRETVRLATRGGASALGMDDRIGSLEAGKLADVVIIAHNTPNMLPDYDPYATLVYAASPLNVDTVICNGRLIVENRRLLTYDYAENLRNMLLLSREVWQVAKDL